MRRLRLMLLAFVVACGSPEKKAQDARDELSSWAATGEMLSRHWSRGDAPDAFVRSTLKVATHSLQGLTEPLRSDGKAEKTLSRVTQLYDTFGRAFQQHDRGSAEKTSREFAAISRGLQQEKGSSPPQ